MSFGLNFGNNITATYDAVRTTSTTSTGANNYVDHLGATAAGNDLTITLGRAGLADLQHTVTLASGSGTTRENVEDWVNDLIVPGLGIGASYDDAAGELTLSAATAPGNDYFFISLNSLSVTPSDRDHQPHLRRLCRDDKHHCLVSLVPRLHDPR